MTTSARASIVYGGVANDHDAVTEDLHSVLCATRHCLRHRMIAGSSIVQMAVELYAEAPPSFNILYYGANYFEPGVDVDTIVSLLNTKAEGVMSRLGLQFLTPSQRAAKGKRMQAAEEKAAAMSAGGTSAGAGSSGR